MSTKPAKAKPKKHPKPLDHGRSHAPDCSDFLREQVRLLKDSGWVAHAKDFEKAITALRVIHTWATFREGVELVPEHVASLTTRALKNYFNRPNTD